MKYIKYIAILFLALFLLSILFPFLIIGLIALFKVIGPVLAGIINLFLIITLFIYAPYKICKGVFKKNNA